MIKIIFHKSKLKMIQYKIGVDGGGSKTHALLINPHHQIIDEITTGPSNIKTNLNLAIVSINSAIKALLNKNNLPNNSVKIGIGVAGFNDIKNRNILLNTLQSTYCNVILTSDCHLACLAAHTGGDGSILICGTGIVAYYLQNGIGYQIGGWGFPHGDLGGGAWLGLELCKLLCKAIDGSGNFSPLLEEVFLLFHNDIEIYKTWLLKSTPDKYAKIAKLITDFITANDPIANEVFARGCAEIELFLHGVLKKTNHLPIKISGGLSHFYLKALNPRFPKLELNTTNNAFGVCYL
jgi:glucosamine kinase